MLSIDTVRLLGSLNHPFFSANGGASLLARPGGADGWCFGGIPRVNLILNKEAIKELIQNELNEKNLVKNLGLILENKGKEQIQNSYKQLRNKLGEYGASKKTANLIVNYFENL